MGGGGVVDSSSSSAVSSRSKRPMDQSTGEPITPLCLVMVSPVPAMYLARAHIVSWTPVNVNHLVTKADKTEGYDYLFTIVIADKTDSTEVIMHGEAAAHFIGVSANEFNSSKELKKRVKDCLNYLKENTIPHDYYLQLYYANVPANLSSNSKKSAKADKDGNLTLKSAIDKVNTYRNSGLSLVRISLFKSSFSLMDVPLPLSDE